MSIFAAIAYDDPQKAQEVRLALVKLQREYMKFDFKHWKDIERLAIVGESKWEEGMSVFCKPFTAAKIQYFDIAKLAEAKAWIDSE
jgi:hypothetical protein